jgi:hypothetical protein
VQNVYGKTGVLGSKSEDLPLSNFIMSFRDKKQRDKRLTASILFSGRAFIPSFSWWLNGLSYAKEIQLCVYFNIACIIARQRPTVV